MPFQSYQGKPWRGRLDSNGIRRVNVNVQLLPVSSMWPIGPLVGYKEEAKTLPSNQNLNLDNNDCLGLGPQYEGRSPVSQTSQHFIESGVNFEVHLLTGVYHALLIILVRIGWN